MGFSSTLTVLLGVTSGKVGSGVGDPTCWADLNASYCCNGVHPECWDSFYTFRRCCADSPASAVSTPSGLTTPSLSRQLALGIVVKQFEATFAACWSEEFAETSYERCCSVRHGLRGNAKCWLKEHRVDFTRCCVPAIEAGLDRCIANAGKWCTDRTIGWMDRGVIDHRAYVQHVIDPRVYAEFVRDQPAHAKRDQWEVDSEVLFDVVIKTLGVKKDDTVLDLGCGPLRLGRLLIPYLGTGSYLAVDKSLRLIEAAWYFELDDYARSQKPYFVVTDRFELDLFQTLGAPKVDVAFAFSLLTHLNGEDIAVLLRNLAPLVSMHHRFYATVRLIDRSSSRRFKELQKWAERFQAPSEATSRFFYSLQNLSSIAAATGWYVEVPDFPATACLFCSEQQRLVLFRRGSQENVEHALKTKKASARYCIENVCRISSQ